jgi:glycerol-3-phosphate cytidylyltransferase-like family protein
MKRVFVSAAFDEVRLSQIRFLHEASRVGLVSLFLWPDARIEAMRGHGSAMKLEERAHYYGSLRYVDKVEALPADFDPDRPEFLKKRAQGAKETVWALVPAEEGGPEAVNARKLAWCRYLGIKPRVLSAVARSGLPYAPPSIAPAATIGRKRVVVSGSFERLGPSDLRFFERASELGELNVVIDSDDALRSAIGEERSYIVGSFGCVMRCLVSSGSGDFRAAPELGALKPDLYIVDTDGDAAEKRRYCEEKGIEYIVLER